MEASLIRWIVLLACVGYAFVNLMEKVGSGSFYTTKSINLTEGLIGPSIANSSTTKKKHFQTTIKDKSILVIPTAKIKFSGICVIVKKTTNDIGPYSIVVGWGDLPKNRNKQIINKEILNTKQYMNMHLYSDNDHIQKGLRLLSPNSEVQIIGRRVILKHGEKRVKSFIQPNTQIPLEVIWVDSIQIKQTIYR
jgi:hypothetical protein